MGNKAEAGVDPVDHHKLSPRIAIDITDRHYDAGR
jgi:hypothetical protein